MVQPIVLDAPERVVVKRRQEQEPCEHAIVQRRRDETAVRRVASWPSTSAIDQLDVVRALGLVGGFELRLDAVELALRQPERT
jgi:hypothetical protein